MLFLIIFIFCLFSFYSNRPPQDEKKALIEAKIKSIQDLQADAFFQEQCPKLLHDKAVSLIGSAPASCSKEQPMVQDDVDGIEAWFQQTRTYEQDVKRVMRAVSATASSSSSPAALETPAPTKKRKT